MNSFQIDKILSKVLQKNFKGVMPSDAVFPNSNEYPYGFVVNTDPHKKPGQHWQAVWCNDKNNAEFFDSFGKNPHKHLNNYFKNFKNLKKTTKKLQNNYEISCGPFVIYFLIKRFKGYSFENIINRLALNHFNDSFVKLFVYNITKNLL